MTTAGSDSREYAQFQADRATADTWIITVAGEVDLDCRDRFQAAVEQATRDEPAKLVFDVAAVRFMDSSGLAVMVAAAQQAGSVEVRSASPAMRRVIEITGLTEFFGIDR